MAFVESSRKIGVFSHGGTKNLGDEALFSAVIQNVRLRVSDAEVIGFTINPDDTRERHGIRCFPIRRREKILTGAPSPTSRPSKLSTNAGATGRIKAFIKTIPGLRSVVHALYRFTQAVVAVLAEPKFLLDSYRRLRGVELLLVAGSQQLSDGYGGAWGFPFTLYKWTLLSKISGTKVAILSVGAGPIRSPLSKLFFKRILNGVSYRSYRDAISSRLMKGMGIKGNHPVFPDLVYSLQLPAPRPAPTITKRIVVGTNPVPFFDGRYWATSDPERYQDYVNKFARFTEWLVKNGHSVLFFPTQIRSDVLTITDIRSAMNGAADSPHLLPSHAIQNLEDLVSEISRADLVVANRYHGILISLMLNKPVLGVAYHEKSRAILAQVGLADYALSINDFNVEDLIERFRAMEVNAPAIRRGMSERMAPLRKALQEQYDTVFGLIGVK